MSVKNYIAGLAALLISTEQAIAKPIITCRTWKLDDPSQYPAFLKNAAPEDRNYSIKNASAQESSLKAYEDFLNECNGDKSDSRQRCTTGINYYVQQIANGLLTGLGVYIPCKYVDFLPDKYKQRIVADPKKYASEAVRSQY